MKMTVEAEVAKANAELQKINKSINDIKASQERANKSFSDFLSASKVVAGAGLIIGAIKKIKGELQDLVNTYKENELAQARLEGVLQATGNATEANIKALAKMSEELQANTLLQGSQITEAQKLLLTYSRLGGIFEETLKAAADVSATLGTDLTSSAKKLAQALEDPKAEMNSLKVISIVLSKEKQDLITKLQEEGRLLDAQKILLEEVNTRYGGMAQKINSLDSSPIDRINTAIGNIKSDVGEMLLSSFGPALEWMVDNVERVARWVNDLTAKFTGNIAGMADKTIQDKIKQNQETLRNLYANLNEYNVGILPKYYNGTTQDLIAQTEAQIERLEGEIDELLNEQKQRKIEIEKLTLTPQPETTKGSGTSTTEKIEKEKSMYEQLFEIIKGTNAEKLHSLELSNKQIEEETANIQKAIAGYENLEKNIESTKQLLSKARTQDEEKKYQEVLDKLIAEKELTKEAVANSALLLEGLEQKKKLNNEAIADLTKETTQLEIATKYLEDNLSLLADEIDYKKASLQADIEKARAMREVEGLTAEQLKHLERIEIKLKEDLDALTPTIDTQAELNKLIEDNASYITKSTEERIKELQTLHAQIVAQSQKNDLTKKQYDQLLKIAQGITREIESLKEVNSWAEKIRNTFNKSKPKGWDDWFKNLEGGIKEVKTMFDGLFTSINNLVSSSFAYKQNVLEREVQAYRSSLDRMKSENDQTRDAINEKERERLQALKEQYDADAISYEEYVAGKLAAETEASNERKQLRAEEEKIEKKILEAQNKLAREKFEADKKNQVATALMNGATAIIRGYADLGPIAGSIAAVTIGAVTAAQIASINQQKFIPALKEGGVAVKPTLSQIGDGNEPELVLPLSKAKDFGFGNNQTPSQTVIVNLNNATIYGIEDFGKRAYDAIKSAQRVGKVPKMAF